LISTSSLKEKSIAMESTYYVSNIHLQFHKFKSAQHEKSPLQNYIILLCYEHHYGIPEQRSKPN